ncbi:MAG: 50S ribosomal protein L10 [Puniceicoccaceae bacterium]
MRPEKEYLVKEVESHLAKSDYLYLTGFNRLTVDETAQLRGLLAERDAEFHVIKNSILNVAAHRRELPDMSDFLSGQTAIVVGGTDAPGVAKILLKFAKDKEKVELKSGILDSKLITTDEVEALSKLPGIEALRAQLLGLLSTPATSTVRVLNAAAQNFLNVLQAKVRAEGGEN